MAKTAKTICVLGPRPRGKTELGEGAGHPFRGNQHTGGVGSDKFADMRKNAGEFEKEGGDLRYMNPGEMEARVDEVEQMREFMDIKPHEDVGIDFTKYAMQDAGDTSKVIMATTEDGIAGALSIVPNEGSDGRKTAYVDYLGTTGIAEGTGSALVEEATKWAADNNMPIVGHPVADAMGFWDKMGWKADPEQLGESVYGLTLDQTKAAAR